MMRRPHLNGAKMAPEPIEFLRAAVDRLSREKADLLEEVRQLRAAVEIYRSLAEHATGGRVSKVDEDAA